MAATSKRSTAARTQAKPEPSRRRTLGRALATAAPDTPLNVRPSGVNLDAPMRRWVEARTGRQLEKFSEYIERVTVRFKDLNGPRGGSDTLCRTKVVLSELPSVVVEERAPSVREAFDLTAAAVTRAVRKAIDRASHHLPQRKPRERKVAAPQKKPRASAPQGSVVEEGSLIGRRVGQSKRNLARALERPEKKRRAAVVDTSLPGVSASSRRVGNTSTGVSTARRNTKGNRRGMTAALEDSATGKPTRKSTRGSQNRVRAGTKLEQRQKDRVTSPQMKALRAM